MRPRISSAICKRVAAQAGDRCGYCLTPQSFTAMPMHIEHILPLAAGGSSAEDNLWLACPLCNGFKGARTHAIDPDSGLQVALFDPRRQTWGEHFLWSDDGLRIVGRTSCGRATVLALQLNNDFLLQARLRWVMVGWHPPSALD